MKVYISADIEGITDVTTWDETEQGKTGYREACQQMTAEVAAACRGAYRGGATEIVVKDAHDSALNLHHGDLPEGVRLIREWAGEPESMVALVNEGFDAAIFVGYHSMAASDLNPLAHTSTYTGLFEVKINGKRMSEMEINAMSCAQYKVPVIMVTGDEGICEETKKVLPSSVQTVASKRGVGKATVNEDPRKVVSDIDKKSEEAVRAFLNGEISCIEIPETLTLELTFREHARAKRAGHYPGAEQTGPYTVRFTTKNYRDMQIAYSFMV